MSIKRTKQQAKLQLNELKSALDTKRDQYQGSLDEQSGWLGKTSDFLRNKLNDAHDGWGVGGSKNAKKEFKELEQAYKELEDAFKDGDYSFSIEAFEDELEDVTEQLEKREMGNKAWNDGLATTAAIGVAAVAAATAGTTLGAMGVAAATGGVTKVAVKWSDEVSSDDGEGYSFKEGAKDFATGSLDAGFTTGGAILGKAAAQKAGTTAVKGFVAAKGVEASADFVAGTGVDTVEQLAENGKVDAGRAVAAGATNAAAGVVFGSGIDGIGHGVKKAKARMASEAVEASIEETASKAAAKNTAQEATGETAEDAVEDALADTVESSTDGVTPAPEADTTQLQPESSTPDGKDTTGTEEVPTEPTQETPTDNGADSSNNPDEGDSGQTSQTEAEPLDAATHLKPLDQQFDTYKAELGTVLNEVGLHPKHQSTKVRLYNNSNSELGTGNAGYNALTKETAINYEKGTNSRETRHALFHESSHQEQYKLAAGLTDKELAQIISPENYQRVYGASRNIWQDSFELETLLKNIPDNEQVALKNFLTGLSPEELLTDSTIQRVSKSTDQFSVYYASRGRNLIEEDPFNPSGRRLQDKHGFSIEDFADKEFAVVYQLKTLQDDLNNKLAGWEQEEELLLASVQRFRERKGLEKSTILEDMGLSIEEASTDAMKQSRRARAKRFAKMIHDRDFQQRVPDYYREMSLSPLEMQQIEYLRYYFSDIEVHADNKASKLSIRRLQKELDGTKDPALQDKLRHLIKNRRQEIQFRAVGQAYREAEDAFLRDSGNRALKTKYLNTKQQLFQLTEEYQWPTDFFPGSFFDDLKVSSPSLQEIDSTRLAQTLTGAEEAGNLGVKLSKQEIQTLAEKEWAAWSQAVGYPEDLQPAIDYEYTIGSANAQYSPDDHRITFSTKKVAERSNPELYIRNLVAHEGRHSLNMLPVLVKYSNQPEAAIPILRQRILDDILEPSDLKLIHSVRLPENRAFSFDGLIEEFKGYPIVPNNTARHIYIETPNLNTEERKRLAEIVGNLLEDKGLDGLFENTERSFNYHSGNGGEQYVELSETSQELLESVLNKSQFPEYFSTDKEFTSKKQELLHYIEASLRRYGQSKSVFDKLPFDRMQNLQTDIDTSGADKRVYELADYEYSVGQADATTQSSKKQNYRNYMAVQYQDELEARQASVDQLKLATKDRSPELNEQLNNDQRLLDTAFELRKAEQELLQLKPSSQNKALRKEALEAWNSANKVDFSNSTKPLSQLEHSVSIKKQLELEKSTAESRKEVEALQQRIDEGDYEPNSDGDDSGSDIFRALFGEETLDDLQQDLERHTRRLDKQTKQLRELHLLRQELTSLYDIEEQLLETSLPVNRFEPETEAEYLILERYYTLLHDLDSYAQKGTGYMTLKDSNRLVGARELRDRSGRTYLSQIKSRLEAFRQRGEN